MPVKVTWPQALAWRMRRQLLDPVGTMPVEDVVRRLCAVQAQVASSAELAVRVRRVASAPGEVTAALADGRLLKTWAMRGTLHLLTPEDGGTFLSLIAAARPWERPAWQRYFGMTPALMAGLRGAVGEALDDAVLTREELIAAVVARPGLEALGDALRSGWGTLLKPLAWQGDLCFGPQEGSRVTFTRPAAASARWAGLPDPEAAGPAAVAAYLGAYGPATIGGFSAWMAGGWFGTRRMRGWFTDLGGRIVAVEVDGQPAWILAEHADAMAASPLTSPVRLLPGFDQYVLGPGTADTSIIAPARRKEVSRQSGWISPVIVAGGRVSGTWELVGDRVRAAWFGESGPPPEQGLLGETERLGTILQRELSLAVVPT